MRRALEWQLATVTAIRDETPRVKSFTLALPAWTLHRAGQHYDLRLTAPDGYQAQRSYSIASAPERAGAIELTVERLPDGEVSSYLHDVLVVGDLVELRGPIGGYFVWEAARWGRCWPSCGCPGWCCAARPASRCCCGSCRRPRRPTSTPAGWSRSASIVAGPDAAP